MIGSEHVQSKKLAQVEEEKEIFSKELIGRNNEIVAMKQHAVGLQKRIDSHICVVIVPEHSQNPSG